MYLNNSGFLLPRSHLRHFQRNLPAQARTTGNSCLDPIGFRTLPRFKPRTDYHVGAGAIVPLERSEAIFFTTRALETNEVTTLTATQMATSTKVNLPPLASFKHRPYDTGLDTAPVLDETVRPKATFGDLIKTPVGSTAVRDSIEKCQPHGHIHEAGGEAKIGRTLLLNLGNEYQAGILRGYLINIDEKGVRSFLRVEG